jgi:hypothetical protein
LTKQAKDNLANGSVFLAGRGLALRKHN